MPLQVEQIGSFHLGGHTVSLHGLPPRVLQLTPSQAPRTFPSDGDFETGQMYVQFVRLVRPSAPCPILLWHGGGMTGVTWETKPDGGAGWQSFFLHAGWDVFVSDAVERGRASWSRFPEIYPEPPHFRSRQESWELFRFGPPGSYDRRQAYPGTLFPVAHFDQFAKQVVPRWGCNDDATQAAYDALVQRVGASVVLVHSQGGVFGLRAALHAPDKVRAVVAIEPSGTPDPRTIDIAAAARVPHLLVLGDYMAGNEHWQSIMAVVSAYWQALRAAGGIADILDLPARGIAGNSHFPMMDRNADTVAGLIDTWLKTRLAA
jgi:pimeloyl-ACP methyl ester carboxylesterase